MVIVNYFTNIKKASNKTQIPYVIVYNFIIRVGYG